MLEDEDDTSHYADPDTLSITLAKTAPKVVILNACRTAQHDAANTFMGIAPALVTAGFPAVIAMQFAIPNETAARFARQMYHFLAMGLPLDTAITEARINVYAHDKTFWAIPVLFMRAADGVIWTERE